MEQTTEIQPKKKKPCYLCIIGGTSVLLAILIALGLFGYWIAVKFF